MQSLMPGTSDGFQAVPVQLSLDFLQEPESGCGPLLWQSEALLWQSESEFAQNSGQKDARVLRAAATLAVADWVPRSQCTSKT